jgi:hypothetical protein
VVLEVAVFEVVAAVVVVAALRADSVVTEAGVTVAVPVLVIVGDATTGARSAVLRGLNFRPGAAVEGFCFGGRVFYTFSIIQ